MEKINNMVKGDPLIRKVGFIGLGVMGLPMATNLLTKSRQEIIGFDIESEKLLAFQLSGGTAAQSAEQIYSSCDVIIQVLPTQKIVTRSIEQAIDHGKPGNIIVDMSSTAPDIIIELNEKAKNHAIYLLDSPVSGGDILAQEGTLAIMTGGDLEAFDQVKEYLSYMGSPVYTGGSGSGSLTKLVNNMIVGISLAGIAEAYAFAEKCGIDLQTIFEATRSGFLSGPMYSSKVPRMIDRNFQPGARIAVHKKDIVNAEDYAQKLGIELPCTDLVLRIMNWMDDKGYIDEDHSALIRYFEATMQVNQK